MAQSPPVAKPPQPQRAAPDPGHWQTHRGGWDTSGGNWNSSGAGWEQSSDGNQWGTGWSSDVDWSRGRSGQSWSGSEPARDWSTDSRQSSVTRGAGSDGSWSMVGDASAPPKAALPVQPPSLQSFDIATPKGGNSRPGSARGPVPVPARAGAAAAPRSSWGGESWGEGWKKEKPRAKKALRPRESEESWGEAWHDPKVEKKQDERKKIGPIQLTHLRFQQSS